ncbi:MAG: hypothetical protein JW786_10030, partial [Desulfobacterales bacterium]|nr:hypothetical protein [Desulfobacterales bacterium]
KAYQNVFPKETHRCVGKETGQTAHQERWVNTLRQRVARYVRKTLSFSKRTRWHYRVTKWFIIEYNLSLSFTVYHYPIIYECRVDHGSTLLSGHENDTDVCVC